MSNEHEANKFASEPSISLYGIMIRRVQVPTLSDKTRKEAIKIFYKVPRSECRTKLAWVMLSDDGSSYDIYRREISYNEEFDPGSG